MLGFSLLKNLIPFESWLSNIHANRFSFCRIDDASSPSSVVEAPEASPSPTVDPVFRVPSPESRWKHRDLDHPPELPLPRRGPRYSARHHQTPWKHPNLEYLPNLHLQQQPSRCSVLRHWARREHPRLGFPKSHLQQRVPIIPD